MTDMLECWNGASLNERLYANTEPNERECWIWLGARISTGYGQVHWQGRACLTHRLSYELWHGPIPQGMHVCHTCDTPACINPDHLFTGTQLDNQRDKNAKGRNGQSLKTHCPRGHEYTSANVYLNPKGSRECVTCRSLAMQRHNEKRQLGIPVITRKTHCTRGHKYAGKNLILSRAGVRLCRACAHIHSARYRAKVKTQGVQ